MTLDVSIDLRLSVITCSLCPVDLLRSLSFRRGHGDGINSIAMAPDASVMDHLLYENNDNLWELERDRLI